MNAGIDIEPQQKNTPQQQQNQAGGELSVELRNAEGVTLEQILNTQFRLPGFRVGQKEIITAILQKRDVLAVLPTGGGKSLCYQLPAVFTNKLIIVISPLIALMRDQVANLEKNGIPAGCIHSGQSEEDKRKIFSDIQRGGTYVLYLSPERAQKDGFQAWIRHRDIALFAIDEAHCVSQWGHDFREEYGQLNILKKIRPDVPILALTASATPAVLADISRQLGLRNPERRVHGFYRPNLYYQVETCINDDEKKAFLLQAIRQTPTGRIIVYCGTRKVTETICEFLKTNLPELASQIGFYHAGLSNKKRDNTQQSYANDDLRILVATNAFGMGIDQPDVRLVVHYQMPANIDSLYQEMGRAGRDGLSSTCLLLYSSKDKGLQAFFITSSEAPKAIKNARWRNLETLVHYAEGGECRHSEILTYYKDAQRINLCGHCDSCAPISDRKILTPPPPAPKIKLKPAKVKKEKIKKSKNTDDNFQNNANIAPTATAMMAEARSSDQTSDQAKLNILENGISISDTSSVNQRTEINNLEHATAGEDEVNDKLYYSDMAFDQIEDAAHDDLQESEQQFLMNNQASEASGDLSTENIKVIKVKPPKPTKEPKAVKPPKPEKINYREVVLNAEQEARFQKLRQWRRAKATELDQPAFYILSDQTLKHMAIANPQNMDALKTIYGIGESKLEKYGWDLLAELAT